MKKNKKTKISVSSSMKKKLLVAIGCVVIVLGASYFFLPKSFYKLPLTQWLNPPKLIVVYDVTAQDQESVQGAFDAMQLALKEVGGKAGGYPLDVVLQYNSVYTGLYGWWTKEGEEKVANDAVNNPSVIAFLGPIYSGAAKISMPILNKAGLVQISLNNTYPGLTLEGITDDEPDIYFPTGKRHYFRMVANDIDQSILAVNFLKEQQAKTFYILDDHDTYGAGLANGFKNAAQDKNIPVLAHESLGDKLDDTSVIDLSKRIIAANSDALYYGGSAHVWFVSLVKTLRASGYTGKIMSGDALMSADYMRQMGDAGEGVFTSSLGSGIQEIDSELGAHFRDAYEEEYHRTPAGSDVIAYDAMRILIHAINKVGANRMAVIKAVDDLEDFEGIFGPISFDDKGDVNQKNYQIWRFNVANDKYELVKGVSF